MKKIIVGIVPLLATAAFAVMPSAAQASAPEFGRCFKKAKQEGKGYLDSGCEKGEVGGKARFEWLPGPGPKPKFTSSEGVSKIEAPGLKLTCSSDTDAGEYTGTKTETETIRFVNCEFKGVPCTSAGAASGEMVTTTLTGNLVWEKIASKTVDLDFEGPGGIFLEAECGDLHFAISGSLLVPVKVSKMLTKSTEAFKGSKGFQKPEYYEVGEIGRSERIKDTLECQVGERKAQCGFTSTDKVFNEEAIEVNEVL